MEKALVKPSFLPALLHPFSPISPICLYPLLGLISMLGLRDVRLHLAL